MDKQKINYIVDILLLISFLVVAITGILKLPILGLAPSLPIRTLSNVHDLFGVTVVGLVGIHVALHMKILVAMTKRYVVKKQIS